MTNKIIAKNLKENKIFNLINFLFLSLASFFLASALLLIINLFSSIEGLMADAKTPDYLQMHQGPLDLEALEDFASNSPYVKDFQVLNFLNMEGHKIEIKGQSQDMAVQDLAIVSQSDKFDFLLDLENKPILPSPGEIYLPLIYYKEKTAEISDPVKIAGKDFTLKGFFRDSQMNSNLAGSKRILVHQDDFKELFKEGENEYLIEFLLHDRKDTSDFERSFQERIKALNGPSISYVMFQMINGLNDGLMIAIFILLSLIILAISLLCIRFILLASMEEDFKDIAVMKALGIDSKDIQAIYLGQYAILSFFAMLTGYLFSFIFQKTFLKDILLYMGKSSSSVLSHLLAILGPIFLFILVLFYVHRKVALIGKISPVKALRDGQESLEKERKIDRRKSIDLSKPVKRLALHDLVARRKLYRTIFIVVFLSSFLSFIPFKLYSSLSHKDFLYSLGMGDARMIIEYTGEEDLKEKILQDLEEDEGIDKYGHYDLRNIPLKKEDGQKVNMKTSLGDHRLFPVRYKTGQEPKNEDDIAISEFYADELELKLGDYLLTEDNKKLEIVGIYGDISNGGRTAKASFSSSDPILKSSILVTMKNQDPIKEKIENLQRKYPASKIASVKEYLDQSFGPLIKQTKKASQLSLLLAIFIIALVTSLSGKLLLIKDRKENSLLKTIGFSSKEITKKYLLSYLYLVLLALVLGQVLSQVFAGPLVSLLTASFGISSFPIRNHWFLIAIIQPLLLLFTGLLFAYLNYRKVQEESIIESMKE